MAKTKKAEPAEIETAQDAAPVPETDQETAKQPDMFASLPNPCVYCGPSVKDVAWQYTTYHGGLPDKLRDFIREHPEALGLIVAPGKFPSMRKRLETKGTPEAELYKRVKASL